MKSILYATAALALLAVSAQASTVSTTVDENVNGTFTYSNSVTSSEDNIFQVLFPLLSADAAPELGDVSSPFNWSASVIDTGSSSWHYDTSVDPEIGSNPNQFESPAKVLVFEYDESAFHQAQAEVFNQEQETQDIQQRLVIFDGEVRDARVRVGTAYGERDRLREERDLREFLVSLAENEDFNARENLNNTFFELEDAEFALSDLELFIAKDLYPGTPEEADAELLLAQDRVLRAQMDYDDAVIRENTAFGELQTAESRLTDAQENLENQERFVIPLVEDELMLAEDAFSFTKSELARIEDSLVEARRDLAALEATKLDNGVTVDGFIYISMFDSELGPVQVGGNTTFGVGQVPAGPEMSAVPLPAGGLLLLSGLGLMGFARARRNRRMHA